MRYGRTTLWCAAISSALVAINGSAHAAWDTFVIRNATTSGNAPVITENPAGYSGWTQFGIVEGGQKAGWATNSMNGQTIGAIQSCSITRHADVGAPGSAPYGPYINIWVTNGSGEYAILSNEPSNVGEWAPGTAYDISWSVLQNATAKVYEDSNTTGNGSNPAFAPSWIGDLDLVANGGDGNGVLTFGELASLKISSPTAAPSYSGGGAPDDLNAGTYTAYGFNWVFGDTAANYIGGYVVQEPTLVPVPPTFITLEATPGQVPDENLPEVNYGDAPTGFGPDSWQNTQTGGKVNWHARYDADGDYLSTLFPLQAATLTVNDIDSISYWTNRPGGTTASQDWAVFIYTRPTVGGDSSWYGYRFVNDYGTHTATDAWMEYSTDTGMQFRRNSGTHSAYMDLDDVQTTYGGELVEMISVQTMSNYVSFDGYMDGLTITLTDGSVGYVDFSEPATGDLELNAEDTCDPAFGIDSFFDITIDLTGAEDNIVGGQFLLEYDSNKVEFFSAAPGVDTFTREILLVENPLGAGTVFYMVGVENGEPGTMLGTTMATLTFKILTEVCNESDLVWIDMGVPPYYTAISNDMAADLTGALGSLGPVTLDVTNPTISCPPGYVVKCPGDMPAPYADLAAFIADGGSAGDTCDSAVTFTLESDSGLVGGPCGGTVTRVYRVTDACGNFAECTQVSVVDDTIDPVITCPGDLSAPSDAGHCYATLSVGMATATDNCDASPVITWVRSDSASSLSDPYYAVDSPITITWTATDYCGNIDWCVQTITVLAVNEMYVEVELSPTIGNVTRCITFELGDTSCGTTAIVPANITFNAVGFGSATIDIPCGAYDCITARDALHTLRSNDPLFHIDVPFNEYVAIFTGNPTGGGNWLIGGNLNDDGWIDILDFGGYIGQYGNSYDGAGNVNVGTPNGDTLCGLYGPIHADFSGNGLVGTEDFTFIFNNILKGGAAPCCGGIMPMGMFDAGDPEANGPRMRISVRELQQLGMRDMIPADLNRDGWLDAADIVEFINGARPQTITPNTINTIRR